MAEVLTHNQTFASPQEALLHYGVKGMRWGVTTKDGPTRGERKQEKRDLKVAGLTSRAAKADIRTAEIKKELAATPKGVKTINKRVALKSELNETTNYSKALTKQAAAVKEGRMTPNQKRLLVGGVVAGGLVLAAYGSTKIETGELNSLKLRGQAALRGKPFDFDRNEAFAHAKTPDEVLAMTKTINPGYNTPGGSMNCRRCTFAYELRRRGNDVAATTSSIGAGQSETGLINALTPGKRNMGGLQSMSSGVASGKGIRAKVSTDTRKNTADIFSHPDAKDREGLFNLLSKQPDGARGEAVFNFSAFGHSLAYEKFGDKVYIFDTQKGKRYDVGDHDSYHEFINKWGASRVKDVQITRLDNQNLDKVFLSRWATNSKDSNKIIDAANKEAERNRAARSLPETMTTSTSSRRRTSPAPSGPVTTKRPANMSDELWNMLKSSRSASTKLPSKRPPGMHITTWNRIRREAGLT